MIKQNSEYFTSFGNDFESNVKKMIFIELNQNPLWYTQYSRTERVILKEIYEHVALCNQIAAGFQSRENLIKQVSLQPLPPSPP